MRPREISFYGVDNKAYTVDVEDIRVPDRFRGYIRGIEPLKSDILQARKLAPGCSISEALLHSTRRYIYSEETCRMYDRIRDKHGKFLMEHKSSGLVFDLLAGDTLTGQVFLKKCKYNIVKVLKAFTLTYDELKSKILLIDNMDTNSEDFHYWDLLDRVIQMVNLIPIENLEQTIKIDYNLCLLNDIPYYELAYRANYVDMDLNKALEFCEQQRDHYGISMTNISNNYLMTPIEKILDEVIGNR